MSQHPIYLSDSIYRKLAKRAAQESKSLDQVAEHLLAQELALWAELDNGQETLPTPIDNETALAAVHRLTTLFADVEIDLLEEVLNDPMLELANSDLDLI
jgi:hypothetical protein